MEYNQSNNLKVRVLSRRPSEVDLEDLHNYKDIISIFLNRENENKLFSIFGPTQDWHIVYNEYGIYYAVRYRFFKKEDFLQKMCVEHPNSFNWILFNPEVLSGEWNNKDLS